MTDQPVLLDAAGDGFVKAANSLQLILLSLFHLKLTRTHAQQHTCRVAHTRSGAHAQWHTHAVAHTRSGTHAQ